MLGLVSCSFVFGRIYSVQASERCYMERYAGYSWGLGVYYSELKCANCVIHDAVKGCPSKVCKSLQLELAVSRMAYSLTQGQKMLVQK